MRKLLFRYHVWCFLLLSQLGVAQDARIDIKWEEKEEAFFQGQLHRVKCEITISADLQVKLLVKPSAALKLLSPSNYKIDAKAGQVHTSNVKLYFPQVENLQSDSLSCEFILQSQKDQSILAKGRLRYEIKERILLRLEPVSTQIPIKNTDTLALIPIRVKNMGKRKYQVEMTLKNKPKGLKIPQTSRQFTIDGKKDTLIQFVAKPEKAWQKTYSTYFEFGLTTLKNGEEAANCKITAFPLTNVKKYLSPHFVINNLYEFNLGYQSRGKNQNVTELNTKGHRPFHQGIMEFGLQTYHYSDTKNTEFANTFLKYHTKKQSLSLGNVSYNDEASSLSGRGIIYQQDQDSQYLHLGLINGSYNLFAPLTGSQANASNSLIGGYGRWSPKLGFVTLNGRFSLQQTSNTGLLMLSSTHDKEGAYLRVGLGLSGAQIKAPPLDRSYQSGFTLGYQFNRESSQWTVQSNSSFSSPYYSGNAPGNLRSSHKVNYLGWSSWLVKGSMQFQRSSHTVSIQDDALKKLGLYQRYQLQFATRKPGSWKLILTPYTIFQKTNFINASQPASFITGSSTRLKTVINHRRGPLSVVLTGDLGRFKLGQEGFEPKTSSPYQLGVDLSATNIGLSASYSEGSSVLSDVVRFDPNAPTLRNFQSGFRWGKWFLKKKLKSNFSHRLSFNSTRRQWANISAFRLRTLLPTDLSLEGEVVVLATANFFSKYWKVNLVKKFGSYIPPNGTQKIQISLYEDSNNNGRKDGAEKVLPGIFIQIDGIPFVTNEEGWILYKAVPKGEYQLIIVDPSGELAADRQNLVVTKNTTLSIPLYKTGVLSGQVKEIKQRFKKVKFDLLGIPIIAKNSQEETFTTYTQSNGSFSFKLPEDEYTIYIDPAAFNDSFEFPDNYQKVFLKQSEKKEMTLKVKVKSRNMKIQKF